MNSNKTNTYLYPSTKALGLLFILVSCVITPGYKYQLAVFGSLFIVALIYNVLKSFTQSIAKSIVVIVFSIFVLQSIFFPGDNVLFTIGFLKIKYDGVVASVLLGSRILAIGSAIILYFKITPTKDIAYALYESGTPKKAVFIFLQTLNMIPELKANMTTIMEAQSSRGIETEGNVIVRLKTIIPLLTPLVLASVESTEERVLTLEARAFTSETVRTSIYILEKQTIDTVLSVVLIVMTIIAIMMGVL